MRNKKIKGWAIIRKATGRLLNVMFDIKTSKWLAEQEAERLEREFKEKYWHFEIIPCEIKLLSPNKK